MTHSHSRRTFLKTAGLTAGMATLGAFPGLANIFASNEKQAPIRLIVDADTANEVDDLYAIVRALIEPRFKIEGLTSAQWHTQERAPNDTVGLSQRLNREILELMEMSDIPHPEGSNVPLVNAHRPQPSEAADLIIKQAHATPEGEKLAIVTLGPNTNLASAVLIDPTIIPKIAAYYIGFWHNHTDGTWNKREFNTNNDPNAANVLIDTPGLEFHVMTATTSKAMVFEKEIVDRHLKGKGGIADYLVNRWESYDRYWQKTDPEKKRWIMWDIAIIEALAFPELATQKEVITPHDNRLRKIYAYTHIDANTMQENYWRAFERFLGK